MSRGTTSPGCVCVRIPLSPRQPVPCALTRRPMVTADCRQPSLDGSVAAHGSVSTGCHCRLALFRLAASDWCRVLVPLIAKHLL